MFKLPLFGQMTQMGQTGQTTSPTQVSNVGSPYTTASNPDTSPVALGPPFSLQIKKPDQNKISGVENAKIRKIKPGITLKEKSFRNNTKNFEGYRSHIFEMMDSNNNLIGMRKIGNSFNHKSIFDETSQELEMYEYLESEDENGSSQYLMPVRQSGIVKERGMEYAYIDFSYVPGNDLERAIEKGLSFEEAKQSLFGVIQALQWLTLQHSLLHSDIKADNFYREQSGHIRLLDLGQLESLASGDTQYDEINKEQEAFINMVERICEHYGKSSPNLRQYLYKKQKTILPVQEKMEIMKFFYDAMQKELLTLAGGRIHTKGKKRKTSKKHRKVKKRKTRKQ